MNFLEQAKNMILNWHVTRFQFGVNHIQSEIGHKNTITDDAEL